MLQDFRTCQAHIDLQPKECTCALSTGWKKGFSFFWGIWVWQLVPGHRHDLLGHQPAQDIAGLYHRLGLDPMMDFGIKNPVGSASKCTSEEKNPGTEMLLLVTQADLCHFSHFYGSWTLHSGDLNQWHPCLAAIKWIKLVYLPPGNPIFPFWADPDCAPAEN